jgi:hypothetical protein
MATQVTSGLSYDDGNYTHSRWFCDSTAAGANAATSRFMAVQAMSLVGAVYAPVIVSTSASQPLFYFKSGTTTTTATPTAITSAATTTQTWVPATNVSLARGDVFWAAHGTDATLTLAVGFAGYAVPGSTMILP